MDVSGLDVHIRELDAELVSLVVAVGPITHTKLAENVADYSAGLERISVATRTASVNSVERLADL